MVMAESVGAFQLPTIRLGLLSAKRVSRSELSGYVELAPSVDSSGRRNTMDFRKGLLRDTNTQELTVPGSLKAYKNMLASRLHLLVICRVKVLHLSCA